MNTLIKLQIEEQLKNINKTKYWLCQNMNITSRNLNRIIRGETKLISFKYIEQLCKLLECTPNELIAIISEKNK